MGTSGTDTSGIASSLRSSEQILGRSHLPKAKLDEAEAALTHLTSQGYRVIALASKKIASPIDSFQSMKPDQSLDFVGFLAVADTLRTSSRRAISVAQQAGVVVRMINGDTLRPLFILQRNWD